MRETERLTERERKVEREREERERKRESPYPPETKQALSMFDFFVSVVLVSEFVMVNAEEVPPHEEAEKALQKTQNSRKQDEV